MDRPSGDIRTLIESNVEAVENGVQRALKECSFKKKSNTWRKENDETVLVVNLQRSSWGAQFYINLGVLIRELDDIPNPTENKCHLRERLEEMAGAERLKAALNAENAELTPEQREGIVYQTMKDIGIPFLESCNSLRGLIHEFHRGSVKRSALMSVSDEFIAKHASANSSP